MKRLLTLLLCLGGAVRPASPHSMYQAAILFDFYGASATAGTELQLPVERLQAALHIQLSRDGIPPLRASISEYVLRNISASLPDGRRFQIDLAGQPQWAGIDGAPYIVVRLHLTPPASSSTNRFVLHCSVLLDRVPAQVVLVSVRHDWRMSAFANQPQLVGVLRGSERSVAIDRSTGSWLRGFGSVFQLGMRHIAEGTDHLLFLLVLLFPATLLARGGRWTEPAEIRACLWQIARIVTAFTAGHSITLAAGALDLIHVPSRPIEVLIAVSILVSAVHALRPLFPGREAIIAGCFGLVHGMAFATTLAELGLSSWERVASILSFNLGIEAMQLIVVAVALPSLLLLSRTRLYPSVRITGALFAGAAAIAWIAQRLWDLPNPADAAVTAIAQHALWVAMVLTLLGLIAHTRRPQSHDLGARTESPNEMSYP